MLIVSYLAILASMCNGIDLTAVISGEHLGEFTGNPRGERVHLEECAYEAAASFAATEYILRECGVDRVLTAVAHPERV